jgi:acetyl esterase
VESAQALSTHLLNPAMAGLLDRIHRARRPALQTLTPAAARAAYVAAAEVLEPPRAALPRVEDLVVAGRAARLYAAGTGRLPLLLYLHGGGFVIGGLETHDSLCRQLALRSGGAVLALDYRLAPEHPFPAAVDDAFDSLHWLLAEAGALGVDAARIAVGGDSAGGTLAAATAIHARDRGLPLALQMLIYPGTAGGQGTESHRRLARGYLLDADVIRWFFGNYVRSPAERDDWRFAPLNAPSLARLAPAWIALAEYDPLVDEGLDYAERLRTAGVPVDCTVYEGMIHAFFQHAGFVVRARQAHADACAALRAAFAGPAIPPGD